MDTQRYYLIQGVKTKDNEIIPIWDERLSLIKNFYLSNEITIKGKSYNQNLGIKVIECLYDLKTKKILNGVNLDYYPSLDELEFKKEEVVFCYVEKEYNTLFETKIVDIVYEDFSLEINKGKNLDIIWYDRFEDVPIDDNILYAIKIWKPYYILQNGFKVKFSNYLHHKQKNK